MSEAVLITLIICLTVSFCMFLGTCGAISQAKYESNKDLDGDNSHIDREEFEEYEHMIAEKLEKIDKSLDYIERMVNK